MNKIDTPKRKTVRLANYDYSANGLYFITICTQNHKCIFGDIVVDAGAYGLRTNLQAHVQLSNIGVIAREELELSASIRKEIIVHDYVIMPNHIHVIVEIVKAYDVNSVGAYGLRPSNNTSDVNHTQILGVSHTPLRSPSRTIGSKVRGFKSAVTKQLGYSPWQRNYYEHIIRNGHALEVIAGYIVENPNKWAEDILNPNNVNDNE